MAGSTRNPKILNYAQTPELEKLLTEVNKIDALQESTEAFDSASLAASDTQVAAVTASMTAYTTKDASSRTTVNSYINKLDQYALQNLINPNVDSSSGSGGGTVVVATKLITDKSLADLVYNENNMYVATKSNGFVYGVLPGTADFTFLSDTYSGLSKFNNDLYYSSDLSKLLLSTYDGLVFLDPSNLATTPVIKKVTDGLPSNYITTSLVYNNSGTILVIVGTSKGLSYSKSSGSTFADYDPTQLLVQVKITSLCIIGTILFIGTTQGVYTKDISNDTSVIYAHSIINSTLTNKYVNDIIYDSVNDTLYIASNLGVLIWKNYTTVGSTPIIKTSYDGISSSICYSLALCGSTLYIATDNGITYTKDFGTTFKYITTSNGLSGYVCEKLIMDVTNKKLTVLHAQGLTVQLDISTI
jgi:ligand-binding sensor domain-containing protein